MIDHGWGDLKVLSHTNSAVIDPSHGTVLLPGILHEPAIRLGIQTTHTLYRETWTPDLQDGIQHWGQKGYQA